MSERKASFEDALGSIPVFPLPQVVLFPDAALPLHVFEPRYRAMIKDVLATHGALAIAQVVEGEDRWGQPRFAQVSGGGVILEHVPLPDGRSNIVVLGQARLLLEEAEPPDPEGRPYRCARASILRDRDVPVRESDRTGLVAAATMFATAVRKHDPFFSFRLPATKDIGQVADVCAYQLIVDPVVRQAILEELDPRVRVQMVIHHLATQHGAMLAEVAGASLN